MSEVQLRFRMWMILVPLIVIELNSSFECGMRIASGPVTSGSFDSLIGAACITASSALAPAASCALIARIGNLFGAKPALVVILLVCACGSLIGVSARGVRVVIAGLGIQGFSSGMLSITYATANDQLPAGKAAFGIASMLSLCALAAWRVHERRQTHPLADLRRLTRSGTCLAQCSGLARACVGLVGHAARGGHGRPGVSNPHESALRR
jgi:uncharacterized integral membrane protein